MKLKFKKYLYLINDVSGLLLKKDHDKLEENAKKLRIALIIVCLLFVFSLILNIFFLI